MAEGSYRGRVEKGDRLPALRLTTASGEMPLRDPPAGASVLVLLAEDRRAERVGATEGSRTASLRRDLPPLRRWDARLIVVLPPGEDLPETTAAAGEAVARSDLTVVGDPDGALRAKLGLAPDRAAMVIADRWGEIYQVTVSSSAADLPDPSEVMDLLRYIATQCPECGVPDGPVDGRWEARLD